MTFGSSVVLEGVTLGLLFTAAVGVLTFSLHQKLPYKRLLIITGGDAAGGAVRDGRRGDQ